MPALPGYYTTKEAAEKLGYAAPDTIRQYIVAGKIHGALKIGKTWLVPEQWVIEQEKIAPKGQGNRGITRK